MRPQSIARSNNKRRIKNRNEKQREDTIQAPKNDNDEDDI